MTQNDKKCFCFALFIFYQITVNTGNKKASKVQKSFVLQSTFFSLKFIVTVFVSLSITHIGIHLGKLVDNIIFMKNSPNNYCCIMNFYCFI